MKILILGYSPQRFVNPIVKELNSKGHQVDLLAFKFHKIGNDFISSYNKIIINGFNHISLFSKLLVVIKYLFRIPIFSILKTHFSHSKNLFHVFKDSFRSASIFHLAKGFGNYEIINIQALGSLNAWLPYIKKDQKILISFWGSELLKASQTELSKQKMWLQNAQKISIQSDKLKQKLIAKHTYLDKEKIEICLYPPAQEIYSAIELQKDTLIRADKIQIQIAYNGSTNQNHIAIIKQIDALDSALKSQIELILPFTYGTNEAYKEEVLDALKVADLEYKMIDSFLEFDELAKMKVRTDVFIHLPKTDAFSASMTEALFAGNILITGSWLPYDKLKSNQIHYHDISAIEELPTKLQFIIAQIDKEKKSSESNAAKVRGLLNYDMLVNNWVNFFESANV